MTFTDSEPFEVTLVLFSVPVDGILTVVNVPIDVDGAELISNLLPIVMTRYL